MKAELTPLQSKYYYTEIEYGDIYIRLGGSISTGDTVSDRELEYWGVTREQYDNNEDVTDGSGWSAGIQDDIGWDHVEPQSVYLVAKRIVEALNEDISNP